DLAIYSRAVHPASGRPRRPEPGAGQVRRGDRLRARRGRPVRPRRGTDGDGQRPGRARRRAHRGDGLPAGRAAERRPGESGGDVVTARDVVSARAVAEQVRDPELPMLTIADLGILRDVVADGVHVTVDITPTYSGCPAMGAIRADVTRRLHDAGYAD